MNLATLYLFAVLLFVPALFVESQTTLPAPRNVRNLTPNFRTTLTIAWQNPAGVFYPSYNLYYFSNVDPTVRVISVQALEYQLTNLMPSQTYTIQVAGVLNSVESVRSNPVTFSTTPADPKTTPTLGISVPTCSVSLGNDLTCSWILGPRAVQQINVRIKCPRGSPGAPYIRRKFIRGNPFPSSFTTNLDNQAGKTCKVFFRALYKEVPNQAPYARFARKMKTIRITLNAARNFWVPGAGLVSPLPPLFHLTLSDWYSSYDKTEIESKKEWDWEGKWEKDI